MKRELNRCMKCETITSKTLGGQLLCPQCAKNITGVPAKIEENARNIVDTQSLLLECVEKIRFLLDEDKPSDVDVLEILREVSDMSNLQSRLRELCRDRNALLEGEQS